MASPAAARSTSSSSAFRDDRRAAARARRGRVSEPCCSRFWTARRLARSCWCSRAARRSATRRPSWPRAPASCCAWAQPVARARRPARLLRGLRAAASTARLRRRRHRRVSLPSREVARLDDDRRRRAGEVRDRRADPQRRPADRRMARGGVCRGRARPRNRGRRPHPRRQVRRARAEGSARERGVLHRRARLAPQPGAPPRAAARPGSRRRAEAELGPVRAGHRRRLERGDRRLDPRRGARGTCGARVGRSARRSSGSTSRSSRCREPRS